MCAGSGQDWVQHEKPVADLIAPSGPGMLACPVCKLPWRVFAGVARRPVVGKDKVPEH